MALATTCGQRFCTGQQAGHGHEGGLAWAGVPCIPHCLAWPPSTHCRLRIPPFEKARTVLEALQQHKLVST